MAGPSILLTGATGYVGGRLLAELLRAGRRVRCLARRPESLGHRAGPVGRGGARRRPRPGIDKIQIDSNLTSCSKEDVDFGPCQNANCPSSQGECAGAPGETTCCSDTDCIATGCNGGPRDNEFCEDDATCLDVSGIDGFALVFTGTGNDVDLNDPPNGDYKLLGDDPNDPSDGSLGCTSTCEFSLGSSVPRINDNSMTCVLDGDCTLTTGLNKHIIEIRDPDGHILAIPRRGKAKIKDSGLMIKKDPARFGDACRLESPPPSDCP